MLAPTNQTAPPPATATTVKVDPASPAGVQPVGKTAGTAWALSMSEEFGGAIQVLDATRDYIAFRPGGPAWRTRYPDYLMRLMGEQYPWTGNPQLPEQQYYGREGVTVSGGALHLTATKNPVAPVLNPHPGFRYTSGNINSRDGHAQEYGYFEARMRLPAGPSQWPAFWIFPYEWDTTRQCEIDVIESFESSTEVVHTNQISKYGGGPNMAKTNVGLTNMWHVYGLEWTPTTITWWVDGQSRYVENTATTNGQPGRDMYVILNLAMHPRTDGNYPDKAVVDVDYIRCWHQV